MCFRDEVTLNLQPAGTDRMLPGNIWEGHRYRALKSAALFGPNASGKSSFLKALSVIKEFVIKSATWMTLGDMIPGIDPFRLSSVSRGAPSCFEIVVEIDGHGYRYRVEATQDRVWREKLEHQDAAEKARWLTLIDREQLSEDSSHIELHEKLGPQVRREQIAQDTRKNGLILSRAAERNVEQILPLFGWFKQKIRFTKKGEERASNSSGLQMIAGRASKNPEYLQRLSELVRDADTGITGIFLKDLSGIGKVFKRTPPRFDWQQSIEESPTNAHELAVLQSLQQNTGETHSLFFTEHETEEGELIRFDLAVESDGTLRYWLLGGLLLEDCLSDNLILVDELDDSLHPQLASRIIQLVHSPEFSRSGAQLLFSSQDVTLMDRDLLRRDQIFLTQKDNHGASELYSLWDFEKMPRNQAAWAKNYLAGRFGAVPAFGPLLADIPPADKPTKINGKNQSIRKVK